MALTVNYERNEKLFQEVMGKGGVITFGHWPTKQHSPVEESKAPPHQPEQNTFSRYPTLIETLDERANEEFVPTVSCPFCGKVEDEHANMCCPHYIGQAEDIDYFSMINGFEIVPAVLGALNKYGDAITKGTFDGVQFWDEMNENNYDELNILEIISKYPYIESTTVYSQVPMMATVHTYLFMDMDKKDEFLGILSEVKARLEGGH